MLIYLYHPYRIDTQGRTAAAGYDDHIRQLIEQVLFTIQGERVNRPTFGTGIDQLVFQPNSDELAAATQVLVQGALQEWLSDYISVESVTARNEDSSLTVSVQYIVKRNQQRELSVFTTSV